MNFVVYGKPKPQGSMRAFWKAGMKRAVITSDNKNLKPWRQEVTETAMALGLEPVPAHVPVFVSIRFFFARPKSATEKKRPGMTTKPDSDKLARAILDSLKGVLINDDAQVVRLVAEKFYGEPERAEIQVMEVA